MQILLLVLTTCTWSCQSYDVVDPVACVQVERLVGDEFEPGTTFTVGEDVFISTCGDADLYSVWYGDAGNDYSLKDDRGTDENGVTIWTNTGTNLSIGFDAHVVHAYDVAGTYTITLIATNTSRGSTDVEFLVKTVEQVITITD